MAAFSSNDLAELLAVTKQRNAMIVRECIERNTDKVLNNIQKILDMDRIKERLKEVCSIYTKPWELKIGIYGYNAKKTVECAMGVTLDDVIDRPEFLFKLDNLFNGDRPYGGDRFRVSVDDMRSGFYGWREIILNYYPGGVPTWLLRRDPEMPALEAGQLPASPVPMNSEDDDDKSYHGARCTCRECREHHLFNRNY